jgi:hypothetical protein
MLAHMTARGGFPPTVASWDLGLLDQNGHDLGAVRVNITFVSGNFIDAGVPNTVENNIPVIWPPLSAGIAAYSLGIYSHFDGQLLQIAPLASPPVSAGIGDTITIPRNSMTSQRSCKKSSFDRVGNGTQGERDLISTRQGVVLEGTPGILDGRGVYRRLPKALTPRGTEGVWWCESDDIIRQRYRIEGEQHGIRAWV